MSEEKKEAPQKIVIAKSLRRFFFSAFKRRPELKGVAKEIGKIDSVTVIISKGKNILRAKSGEKKRDVDFSQSEIDKLLKSLRVKKETVDACKNIFVMMDFNKLKIFIQQNRLDGTIKEFDI